MQDAADGKSQAGQSVSLLKTATVAFVILGLLSGLFHTFVQQQLLLQPDVGTYTRYAAVGRFIGVAFWLVGLLQIYAALLLTRPQFGSVVRGLAVGSVGCLGVGLLLNLLAMVLPDVTMPWFASTKWIVLWSLLDLTGVLLLMVAVLQVSRRSFDWLAIALVVVLIVREALAWGTTLLINDRTLTTIWIGFAVRAVCMLAEQGLRYGILARASTDLATPPNEWLAQKESELGPSDAGEERTRGLVVGGLWLVGGLLVSVVSYSAAASSPAGGKYMVAYGAVVYGIVRIVRSLSTR